MAKHWSQYFESGLKQLQSNIDIWNDTAEKREILPSNNNTPAPRMRNTLEMRNAINSSAENYDHGSVKSAALRKSQSIHASTGSLSQVNDSYQMSTMSRHMSEHSLASSPPSKALNVTALFAYIATGENQLSFYEGDKISVIGEKNDGWQFGENLRTSSYGWFPISYVQSDVER
jgi:BAI1-associated protein 2